MATQSDVRVAQGVLDGDARWSLIQRIITSAAFQRSQRLRSFLLHVGEHALLHPGEAISEHQIGCAVFERAADYSPSEDNIVRVHARQLRTRLEEYFAGPGVSESLLLEIPKGSYIPVFKARTDAPQFGAIARLLPTFQIPQSVLLAAWVLLSLAWGYLC